MTQSGLKQSFENENPAKITESPDLKKTERKITKWAQRIGITELVNHASNYIKLTEILFAVAILNTKDEKDNKPKQRQY